MKDKWSSGKIACVVVGGIVGFVALMTSLVVSIILLPDTVRRIDRIFNISDQTSYDFDGLNNNDWYVDDLFPEDHTYETPEDDFLYDPEEKILEDFFKDGQDKSNIEQGESTQYYEMADAVRDDLSYQVEFKRHSFVLEANPNINVKFLYPEITGENVTNLENINASIRKEISTIEEYVEAVPEYMGESEEYLFEGTGYVTYMDEDILSVVYSESEFYGGQEGNSYLVAINIDMRSGMVISNTNLLQVDDDFAVDFRNRSDIQNGESQYLTAMSDQEIASYLTDGDYAAIFYTPLGMEVGFNFYAGWITVTYKDYEQYLKKL